MPAYEDESRKVFGPPLDARELSRDRPDFNYWVEHNALGRQLVHLLGYDGAKSLFLRCNSSGVLRVVDESAGGVAPADPVAIKDGTTAAQKLAVSAAGRTGVTLRDPTTDAQALVVSAAGRLGATIRDGTTDGQALAIDAAGKLGAIVSGAVTVSGPVNVADPTTPAQKLAVDAAGKLGAVVSGAVTVSGPVNIADPATPAQKLAVDAAGKVGAIVSGLVSVNVADPVTPAQVALVNASGELLVHDAGAGGGADPVGIKDGTTPTQKLAVDASGRVTVAVSDGATPAERLAVSSAGRVGVTLRDPVTDTNIALVTLAGGLYVSVQEIIAAQLRRVLTGSVVVGNVVGAVVPSYVATGTLMSSASVELDLTAYKPALVRVSAISGGAYAFYGLLVQQEPTAGGAKTARGMVMADPVVVHVSDNFLCLTNNGSYCIYAVEVWTL